MSSRLIVWVVLAWAALCPCGRIVGGEPAAGGTAAASIWTYEDFLRGRIPQTYKIREGHPRLLITPENRAEIIAKARAAPKLLQAVIRTAERGKGEEMVLACGAIHQLGLIPGFEYALSRRQYGRKGVEGLMSLIGAEPPGAYYGPGYLLGLPCGYDWLHALLSMDQKRALVEEMLRVARQPQAQYNDPLDGINGHIGGPRMTMGLACYGDGIDDEGARGVVEHAFRQVWWNPDREQVFPAIGLQTLLYMEGGGWVEGISYLGCSFRIFAHMAAWKTATGQDYFARMGFFRSLPYWMTHAIVPKAKPGKGYVVPLHNYHAGRMGSSGGLAQMMAAATGYLKDVDPAGAALARWWLDQSYWQGMDSPRVGRALVYGLLIGDPRVKAAPPAALNTPRTLVMRGMNLVYMRSRWADPDATVVAFGNNRFGCYRARAFNQLSLWKNGGSLIGYRGQIAGHYYYSPEAVPASNVVFYEENTRLLARPRGAGAPKTRTVVGSPQDVGSLSVHSVPGQVDYLLGECGRGYRGKGVKRCERTLVYLRPATGGGTDYLVIRDRTQTDSPSLVPHATFQTVLEPRIGADWDRDDKGELVLPGQWRIEDGPCVTITNDHTYSYLYPKRTYKAHGRAFLRTLLPASIRTLKVGGEAHPLDGLDGKPATKYLEAFNKRALADKRTFAGLWRFHVVPKAEATSHVFVHVIEATDSKVARPGVLALLKGTGGIGIQAGPNVVVFSQDGGALHSASLTVAAGTTRIVVGDLSVGRTYSVGIGDKTIAASASAAGSMLVKDVRLAPGGSIRIAPAATGRQEQERQE
jgi:hypothetical protein